MCHTVALMRSFLDFLFPKHSLEGKEGEWITPSEFTRLVSCPRVFQREELRKLGVRSLDRVFAASTYCDVPLLRKAIALFKYRRIPGLGGTLQGLLVEAFLKHCTPRRDACICPVPLHFLRKFWRKDDRRFERWLLTLCWKWHILDTYTANTCNKMLLCADKLLFKKLCEVRNFCF